jgi:predicted nucleotidyltransferase
VSANARYGVAMEEILTPTPREILRVEVGSTLHGTGLPGHEDLDLMGIYVPTAAQALGAREPKTRAWRTAKKDVRSTADDVDLSVYPLRHYVSLAAAGNPSILLPLFAPEAYVRHVTVAGTRLRLSRSLFISKRAGLKFLGYMHAQRERMEDSHAGRRAPRSNRPELEAQFGYDTKFAMHMLRLGFQGLELMTDGTITLPVGTEAGDLLREVRAGAYTYERVVRKAVALQAELEKAVMAAPWDPTPDPDVVDELSRDLHFLSWGRMTGE